MNSITIITSPFASIPPHAIGAIERRWYQVGCFWRKQGYNVYMVVKSPSPGFKGEDWVHYIKGYNRTGKLWKDLLLDLIYSWKALYTADKADVLILNSFWSPLLYPFFKGKFGMVMYNVARFPKKQMGVYKNMDVLSCVSSAVRDALIEQSPSMKNKTTFINNPIDTNIFHSDTPHKFTKNISVVYSGRVHQEKGLDILIKAVNDIHIVIPNVTLTIIGARDIAHGGGGEKYIDYLTSLAKGWEIKWVDPIYDSRELAKELAIHDVFCYPSVADKGETFGVAPLEAMGLGLVTIVSALGCFKDFVDDGVNGLVFNHHADDPVNELRMTFNRVLTDETLFESISSNAIATSKKFCVSNIANDYITLFEKILKSKNKK